MKKSDKNSTTDENIIFDSIRELKKGDILFCQHTEREFGKIHCAMYIGDEQFIESMPFFGVRFSAPKDIAPFWNLYFYGYVKNVSEEIIDDAIEWACKQRGCGYQYLQFSHSIANYEHEDKTDPLSNRWYCSELVWAAYMNASDKRINLGNPKKIHGSKYRKVWVVDLQKDTDNIQIFHPENALLPLRK